MVGSSRKESKRNLADLSYAETRRIASDKMRGLNLAQRPTSTEAYL